MCTVTFIPVNNKTFITSNRDEKHWRSSAIEPKLYSMKSGKILFPRDSDSGGTWFAAHENGNAIVFLNGAFIKHVPQPPYKKSRGLVLLDLIDDENPVENFLRVNLENIEPFTAIILDNEELFECRWDGEKKYQIKLNHLQPHIWSSATLYDKQIVEKRKKWFEEWLYKNPLPDQNDILKFHQFSGDGDSFNDLVMNRNGIVFTVSITSLEIKETNATMQYVDIKNQQSYMSELTFTKAALPK